MYHYFDIYIVVYMLDHSIHWYKFEYIVHLSIQGSRYIFRLHDDIRHQYENIHIDVDNSFHIDRLDKPEPEK